jgi:hypothetical protein
MQSKATTLRPAPMTRSPPGSRCSAPDNTITSANPAARMWLSELRESSPGHPLPPVVTAVASRARSIAGRAKAAATGH